MIWIIFNNPTLGGVAKALEGLIWKDYLAIALWSVILGGSPWYIVRYLT